MNHGPGEAQPQFRVTWDMLSCLRYLRSAAFNEYIKTNPTYDPDDLLDIWSRCTQVILGGKIFKNN